MEMIALCFRRWGVSLSISACLVSISMHENRLALGGGEDLNRVKQKMSITKHHRLTQTWQGFADEIRYSVSFACWRTLSLRKSLNKLKHFHYATKSCESENKQTRHFLESCKEKWNIESSPQFMLQWVSLSRDLQMRNLLQNQVEKFPSGADEIMRKKFLIFIIFIRMIIFTTVRTAQRTVNT